MSQGRRIAPAPEPTALQQAGQGLPYAYEQSKVEGPGGRATPNFASGASMPPQGVENNGVLQIHQFSNSMAASQRANLAAVSDFGRNLTRGESVKDAAKTTAQHQNDARSIALGYARVQRGTT